MSATSFSSPLNGGFALTRKPQRLTITVSWSVYQSLIEASDEQGRSISNMAAYWLGLPRFRGQVDRRHAMTLRLSFDDHHDHVPPPVYGAAKG